MDNEIKKLKKREYAKKNYNAHIEEIRAKSKARYAAKKAKRMEENKVEQNSVI